MSEFKAFGADTCFAPALLAEIMETIYENDLTTVSGGNLSIRGDGGVWITPSGTDKGGLTRDDMVFARSEAPCGGRSDPGGKRSPSMELPFHRGIYAAAPDVNAIIHAHAPDIMAASLLYALPRAEILPHLAGVAGRLGFAPLGAPGSEALGESLAEVFRQGVETAIL